MYVITIGSCTQCLVSGMSKTWHIIENTNIGAVGNGTGTGKPVVLQVQV